MVICPSHQHVHLIFYSLLVAIGIEAFNKFSQEQKAEIVEVEENTTSDIISTDGEKQRDTDIRSKLDMKRYFYKVVSWTRAALSSTRVRELL